jgi:hypothetical protein
VEETIFRVAAIGMLIYICGKVSNIGKTALMTYSEAKAAREMIFEHVREKS